MTTPRVRALLASLTIATPLALTTPMATAEPLLPPVRPLTVLAGFRPPAGPFAAGHRGVDLRVPTGTPVHSPLAGTVVFAGRLVDRPLVVVAVGDSRYTLEPVLPVVVPGQVVQRGQVLGLVGTGGHCDRDCLHLGLRLAGVYVHPLRLHAALVP